MKFRKSQKGFTLVELLIVVVILGILAAVAIPRFLTTREESQKQACKSNMQAAAGIIEEYLFSNTDDITATNMDTTVFETLAPRFPNGGIPKCPRGDAYVVTAGVISCPNAADGHVLGGT